MLQKLERRLVVVRGYVNCAIPQHVAVRRVRPLDVERRRFERSGPGWHGDWGNERTLSASAERRDPDIVLRLVAGQQYAGKGHLREVALGAERQYLNQVLEVGAGSVAVKPETPPVIRADVANVVVSVLVPSLELLGIDGKRAHLFGTGLRCSLCHCAAS